MIEVQFVKETDDIYIIKVLGTLPNGSEGNKQVKYCVDEINKELIKLNNKISVIFDLRKLDYIYGDSISWIWLTVIQKKIKCNIVASGTVFKSISELIKLSIPVDIFKTIEEAKNNLIGIFM